MIDPSRLIQGHHDEAAPSPDLHHHCQELGVDCAEIGIVGISCDPYVFIALLLLERGSEDVTEFGAPDSSETNALDRFLTTTGVEHDGYFQLSEN